jgi:Transposase
MAKLVRSLKIREESSWLGRAMPCSVLQSIRRTPLWASPIPKCSHPRSASGAVEITRIGPVRNVGSPAPGIGSAPAPYMIWATRWGAGPVRSTLPTPNITALDAATTSPLTCLTWPRPRPSTLIGWWLWPSDWSSRTAYPIRPPVGTSGATIGSSSPSPPSRTGWRPGGKKAVDQIRAAYLDWALDGFSGYVAADELYDGPFCVLSLVDNRAFKRLCYEVLDHDPTHGDIEAFFRRFRAALASRGLSLQGITTDGSELYPQPISEVFGAIEHQVCRFHILAELNQSVLHAVASVRKHLAAQKPKLPRGRPSTPEAKRTARRRRHLERKIGDLFEHRHLFVRRQLTPGEQQTLRRISRGLPQLRALRQVVEEIYRLFDRRCRTETALTKLARLRSRVRRFKKLRPIFQKLQSPDLEKALTYLDDSLLGSTSNAVERSNRRHRKMQKTVYGVRTQPTISGRIALDMFREAQRTSRAQTMNTLHHARRR